MRWEYGLMGLAGAMGALLRHFIGVSIHAWWEDPFPLGTLLINYAGCFMLSGLVTRATLPSWLERAIGIGFIGSFTTFSAFSVETIALIEQRLWLQAFMYLLLSIWGGLFFAWLEVLAGKRGAEKRC